MENRAYAIAAGLFTIFLAVGVFIAAKWLTGGAVAWEVYELVSPFPVTGLNPRGTVRYRGVEVGRVESMRLNPENRREILVRVLVDSSVKLTKSSYAQLGYQGVTGIAHVQLEDDGSSMDVLATSALNPARIPVRQSFTATARRGPGGGPRDGRGWPRAPSHGACWSGSPPVPADCSAGSRAR